MPPPGPGSRLTLRQRGSVRQGTGRLLAGLALLLIGALGGAMLGVQMPQAVGAEGPAASASAAPSTLEGVPEGFEVYQEAYRILRDAFVDPDAAADDRALVEGSIRGMVEALGDTGHTVYLTEEELKAETDALDGTVTGIGVTLDSRAGTPTILSVLDGSPAERAGLRSGDTIEAVDGVRLDRSSTDDLVRLVRGAEGTSVELRVRSRAGRTRDVVVVRERFEVPAVDWAFVPGTRTAVIRLVQFSDGAGRAVEDAARAALAQEAAAVILDLRGNPGGLLHEAVAVTSAFLEDGVVYRSVDREGREESRRTRGDAVIPDLPMAVLVDYGSASSAEIVAAALQDAGRATVVGESTYGTGTILLIQPLSDGSAIRLGVQRWLPPSGDSVFRAGLEPDVAVELPPDGIALQPSRLEDLVPRAFRRSEDLQLRRAVRLLTSGRRP